MFVKKDSKRTLYFFTDLNIGGALTFTNLLSKFLSTAQISVKKVIMGDKNFKNNDLIIVKSIRLFNENFISPLGLCFLLNAMDDKTAIIHINSYSIFLIPFLLLNRNKKIITVHSMYRYKKLNLYKGRFTFIKYCLGNINIFLLKKTFNFFPYLFDKIIFITNSQYNLFLNRAKWKKTLLKKSIVINNFIDSNIILTKKANTNRLSFLFIGRLTKQKGFHDLLKVIDSCDYLHFTIIGKGKFSSKIPKRKNIVYLPYVSHADIFSYYDQNTVFILPSYFEVSPITVLEAMARGLPVLVSDIPGMREIIREGKNGYLFSPGDINKIKELILYLKNNPKEIKRISRNNLEDVWKYTTEVQGRKYLKIINHLFKDKNT